MSDPAVSRPEIYREPLGQEQFGVVEKPLTGFERIYNMGWVRKIFVLIVIAAGIVAAGTGTREFEHHEEESSQLAPEAGEGGG